MSGLKTRIPVLTIDYVPGHRIVEYRGLARGTSTRAAAAHEDVMAHMKNLVGGEIPEYTKLLAQCREESLDRLIDHAIAMGANAVVGLCFSTSEVCGTAAELLAFGTAVTIERAEAD